MIPFFGLDIGSYNLKAVQLRNLGPKGYELVTYGVSPSPVNLAIAEADTDLQAISNSIKELIRNFNFSTRDVVTSLPESQIFTRVISLPKMSEREIAKSMEWEAEQYIPISLSDVSLDYQILEPLGETGDSKIDVLLVAAPKKFTNKYIAVLENANLNPIAIETETTASVRSVVGKGKDLPTTLLISIGATTTDLAVVSKGMVRFTRSIPTGGKALARAISSELGFEMSLAEEYKKSYGLDEFQLEGKIMKTIKPIFDVIVSEIKRALAFYASRSPIDPVKRAILIGGTASLPGIVVYLAAALNIEVQLADPWKDLIIPKKFPKDELEEISTSFATAVGLAMKEV